MKHLYRTYFVGFALSLVTTLAAFMLVMKQLDSGGEAFSELFVVGALSFLAAAQLIIQLMFFFHLGKEAKPRFNTISFLSMAMVVGIILAGSLWIMYHLDYNMMPKDVETHVQQEENIHKSIQKESAPLDTHHHEH